MEDRGQKVHVLGTARAVRSWLDVGGMLATWDHGDVRTWAAPRATSGPKVLRKLWWSVLTFVARVTTEGPVDARRLGHHL